MEQSRTIKLGINPSDRMEREKMFVRMCELLCLDVEIEAATLEIARVPSGLNVTIGRLCAFLYEKKLKGAFDFDQKTFVVVCPEIHPKGEKVISIPESIKPTSVDEVTPPSIDPVGFKKVESVSLTEEEEDDLFQ